MDENLHHPDDDDDEQQQCCCIKCNVNRCRKNCWFLATVCGFMLCSSLPRICTILDLIGHIMIYVFDVRPHDQSVSGFIHDEFHPFDFAREGASVVLLSLARSMLLFFTYAYRFHLAPATVWVAVTTMLTSAVYLIAKLACLAEPHSPLLSLLIFSLAISLGEFAVFMVVKRKPFRVEYRQPIPSADAEPREGLMERGVLTTGVSTSPIPPAGGSAKLPYHRLPSVDPFEAASSTSSSSSRSSETTPIILGQSASSSTSAIGAAAAATMGPTAVSYGGDEKDGGIDPVSLAEPDSRFVEIDGVLVHYRLFQRPIPSSAASSSSDQTQTLSGSPGKRGGVLSESPAAAAGLMPAVVLLHGFGGSVFSWKAAWQGLCDSAYTVLAFDRPGFGLTSRPIPSSTAAAAGASSSSSSSSSSSTSSSITYSGSNNPYSTEFSLNLLFRLMREVGIKQPAVLVGHSTGGALAIRAALERPDLISGCFLISPTIYSEGFPNVVRSVLRTRIGKQLMLQLLRTEIGEVAIRRAWHEPRLIPDQVMQDYKRLTRVKNWHLALVEMAGVSAANLKLSTVLQDISVPVCILHGDDDRLVDLSESLRAVKAINALRPIARLIKMDLCGHVPHEELPEAFLQSLMLWFDQTRTPSGGLMTSPVEEDREQH